MSRPRLLDLFCCAGGAGMGYHLAGFDVTGVDIEPQPQYPFTFVQGDAIEYAKQHGHEFDVIHASPPCQAFSPVSAYNNKTRRRPLVDLLVETREVLVASGRPYVIENVTQAPLINPTVLCGTTFDLDVYRHRGFESSVPLTQPTHARHTRLASRNGYLPTPERPVMTITGRHGHHSIAWQIKAAEVLGVPWITPQRGVRVNHVCEAIPPAYTRHVGAQLLEALR